MKPVNIGNKAIGPGEPAYVIAELSGNHGGDLDKALRLLRAAGEAGADAVKLQVYRPDTITLNSDKPDFRIAPDNAWAAYGTLYRLYEYAHTPWEWLPDLFQEAERLGIELFGSVFDETAVDELERYPVPAYKIASPEVLDLGLLAKVASTGKPVLISTGLASLADICLAVDCLRDHGCPAVIPLKCTTAYPTPPAEVNLATLANLRDALRCPVGLSDHSLGMGVAIAAAALGAAAIEKHIKLDDGDPTVDGFFSLTVAEFRTMIEEIRRAEQAVGQVCFQLTPSEAENRHGRRSLYVSAPVRKGEVFSEANIKSVRPGYGLEPRYKPIVLGRRAARDLDIGDRLNWDVIE
jgi:pseudaminic acid synthase